MQVLDKPSPQNHVQCWTSVSPFPISYFPFWYLPRLSHQSEVCFITDPLAVKETWGLTVFRYFIQKPSLLMSNLSHSSIPRTWCFPLSSAESEMLKHKEVRTLEKEVQGTNDCVKGEAEHKGVHYWWRGVCKQCPKYLRERPFLSE